jgi:hypothetical protein
MRIRRINAESSFTKTRILWLIAPPFGLLWLDRVSPCIDGVAKVLEAVHESEKQYASGTGIRPLPYSLWLK